MATPLHMPAHHASRKPHSVPPMPHTHGFARVASVVAKVLAISLVFVAMLLGSVLVHINLPASRRLIAREVSSILATSLQGKVTIERIGFISLRGVSGVDVTVTSPDDVPVARVNDVDVTIAVVDTVRHVISAKDDLTIEVKRIRIRDADASLDADDKGELLLAKSFAAKPKAQPEPPSKQRLWLSFPALEVQHASLHRDVAGSPRLVTDIDDLLAQIAVGPERTTIDLPHANVVASGLPQELRVAGRVMARVVTPNPTGEGVDAGGRFDGEVSGLPAHANGRVVGKELTAAFEIPKSEGAAVRKAFAVAPVYDTVALTAEAHGTLPHIVVKARGEVGPGRLEATTDLVLEDTMRVKLDAHLRHMNVRSFAPTAPAADLGADVLANVTLPQKAKPKITAEVHTVPGSVDGTAVPPVNAWLDYAGDRAHAQLTIDEDGMPTRVDATLEGDVAKFSVLATVADIARVPRVSKLLGPDAPPQGRVTLDTSGSFWLSKKTIDAAVLVNLNGVRTRFAGIDDMHAGVRLTGPVTDLTAALTLSGDGIRGAAGSSWDVSHVDLATTVRKTNAIEVTGTRLELTRGKDVARVYAERVRVSGEHLAVSGARVEGLGQPLEIAFTKDGEIIHVTAHSTGIDVARVGKLAGMTSDLRHGNAGLDADVTLAPHHTRGRVSLHAAELSVSSIERGVVELDASVDDRKVAVVLDAKLGSAGDVHIATNEAELGGDPMNPASWKRVRGRIDVNSAIDLCKLSSTLPPDRMPLNELCGTVEAHGYVARTSTEGLPDVDLSLVTTGLVLAGKEAPRPTEGAQVSTMPWRIAGVDVALAVRIDPKSGDANVNTKLFDSHGDLVTLDAKTKIEGAIAQSGAAGNGWQSLPIEAHVAMPERPVSTLPAVLGLRHTQGTLEFTGAARGSALDPHVDFKAHARGVHEAAADTTLALGYDGHAANVSVHTVARKGGALDVTAKLVAEAKAMLAAKEPLNAAWTATARVEAKEFPIESLDEVIGPRVRGKLDLVAELRDLHQNAVLTVKGSVQDPRIAGVKYRGITIDARAATGGLDAHARLDQMEGFAEVSATSGLTWGAALAPQLDPAHAIDARVSAKNFRASAAQPFMQSVVDELDGVLDGDIALHGAGGKDKPTVEGSLSFRDGLVHAAALGDDLRNVRFRVAAAKGGEVRVDDVYAKGTEGEVKARALLHLDGLGWRDASANVDIAQSGAMGISLQGEPLGRIWGSVAVKATNDAAAQRVTLDVSVPRLNVKLPNASTNNVQKLGEQRADIHIGHYLRENSFIRLARNAGDVKENASPAKQASTATTVLTVDLGDITIVRGNNVNVRVGGKPKVEIGEHTRLTGQLVVKEGKLDVQGHQFEIERGTVTFNGEDPPNPQVLVTATWVAADKTKVFAEFVGPAKGGKLTLRSEPALPRDEVLSLILFGTTDGMSPQPSSASSANQSSGAKAAGAAAGLGGGFVAQGVTEAIDDLAGVRAQARIDTTSSANPRPEIDIQVARDVSVRAAHVIGEPPPTEPDMNFVTVSWRLGRGWSLETTVGDRGRSEVDAIWTHRY